MMKKCKRFILCMITWCLILSNVSMCMVHAAVPSISTSKYLKMYPISTGNNTPVYSSSSFQTKSGTIYASDELYVYKIGSNYAYLSYPTSRGRKKGYVKLSAITANNQSATGKATAKLNVYRRSNRKQYYGYVSKNDKVWVMAKTSSSVQIAYPAGNQYKSGWISLSNYNKYITLDGTGTRTIADGTYMIQSGNSSNRVLDINNWNMNDGGNLEIYQKNNTTNQRFVVTYVGNGYYKIKAYHSGKYLDISGGSSAPGTNVWQYTWNGSDAQLWKNISAGNGYYYIQSKLGTYLDNSNGSTSNGNNVIAYSFNGSKAQQWKFVTTKTDPASTLSISGQTNPGTMTQGSGHTVKGTIRSNYKITKVTVGIYTSSGAKVSEKTVYPNAYSYNINKIDSYIHFSYAKPGTNVYKVVASDSKKSNVVLQQVNFTVKEKSNKTITVYSQTDKRWASTSYGKGPGGAKATISSSGCGILALTNAVYYMNGKFIDPISLSKWSVNNGYRINGDGTSHNLYAAYAKSCGSLYGFKYSGKKSSVSSTKTHLQNGGVAIIAVPGHLMALVDYDSSTGKYLILDSYKSSSRGTYKTGYRWLKSSQFTGKLKVSNILLLSPR